ncbi:MAG: molybdopterin molybdenumtransferase MoeA, partial [Bacteroidota bacterium]
MIEVSEAVGTIIENTVSFGTEKIPLNDSLNRILKEDWFTDRPLPPYDRIAMDGIAINYAAYDEGARQLPVVGMAAAGMQQQSLADPDACLEAMTGAILPLGCDTIIPYEHIEIKDGHAH